MSNPIYQMPMVACAWSTIAHTISLIEDPVYSTLVDTEPYLEVYGSIMTSLDGDGEDSKVSFFFEVSPINKSALIFRNDEAKLFFREEAEEQNLIPRLVEICEGETRQEKIQRTQSEKTINRQHQQSVKRIKSEIFFSRTDDDKHLKVQISAQKQLEKLTDELRNCQDNQIKKSRLEAKIIKINAILDQA
jgi:hypothetical protein